MRWKHERSKNAESNRQYLVRGGIKITMDEMSRAADERVRRSSANRFASGLEESFKGGAIQIFSAFARDVAAERGENVPNREMRLRVLKSDYMIGG